MLRADIQLNERRAEDVPCIEKFKSDSRGDFARRVQMDRNEKLHEDIYITFAIEWLKQVLAITPALLVHVFEVALLEKARISEENVAKFHGGLPREHAPAESLADELRQIAGVVDVGVRKNHVVNRFRIDRQIAVLFERLLAATLIESAVEKYALSIGLDEVHRASCGVSCSVECYLHAVIIAHDEDVCTCFLKHGGHSLLWQVT